MSPLRLLVGSCVVWGFTTAGLGQVVQLPTYHVFSVGTTVVVPDGGLAYLGGIDRAYGESSWVGIPGLGGLPGVGRVAGNRSVASSASSSGVYATATIIDLRELDAAVLAAAAQRNSLRTDSATDRKASFLARNVDRPGSRQAGPAGTGEGIVRRPLADDAESCLELARRAEAAGRLGAARCQYQRAARTAQGTAKQEALLRLAALRDAGKAPPVTPPAE